LEQDGKAVRVSQFNTEMDESTATRKAVDVFDVDVEVVDDSTDSFR
jgi:hypothetical protein